MDASTLRARISPKFQYERAELAHIEKERERLWQQGLPLLEYQDDLDERHLAQGQSVRSAHNAQKRGVERLLRFVSQVGVKAYYYDFSEELQLDIAKDFYEEVWQPRVTEYFNKLIPVTEKAQRAVAQNRKDVKDNFLYEEWLRQSRRPDGIKTYAAYAIFTCLRAAFVLMTSKPGADQLIETFYSGELPDREALLKIGEAIDITSPTNNEVMSWLIAVPNMMEMAEALILHYSDFVRAERVDKSDGPVLHSPLPDDPLEASLPDRYEIPLDVRINNAVEAYKAKEGSADKVARKYGIPQKQFRQVLQDRQLIGSRGGDRKGKSVE